ncbi:endonuclease/exonuclease/phosphatase family protein [Hyunsoonleella ulvae]|uniref:endonuclease/exonuclease/phosphatase family protein n=1 Tax=Hyunsoonleella ulvae TaxID=2799948 RepID=UPI00193AA9F0|nr:endonuclease/exonuclease/phosphatase family protein [Hyunsoonleella ulvae]
MKKFLRTLYPTINIVIVLALLIIHFAIKEESFQSSLFYYSFPLPVVIIIILLLSIFASKSFRKYNLYIVLVLLVIWLYRSFRIHIPDDLNENDLEIVFWNGSHYLNVEDGFQENESIPDIFVLTEHGSYDLETVQSKYSSYYFHKSNRGISIFSKTPITNVSEFFSKFSTAVTYFKTAGLNFYAIDAVASLDVPKAWGLEYIDSKIVHKQNTVILGDFNLPYDSKLFSNIKADFNHAFSEKGNGFRETWAFNLPILSLDYIWVSKDLNVKQYKKIHTFKSDHNMIKTYIER